MRSGGRSLPRGGKWINFDANLRLGQRQLPSGSSLAKLLASHRGARNIQALPPLTEGQILRWADAYHARHGKWPVVLSGTEGLPAGERWGNIQYALQRGLRGLPGGSSLRQLLAARRGVRNTRALPRLSLAQNLRWADAHHAARAAGPARAAVRCAIHLPPARNESTSRRRCNAAPAACSAGRRWRCFCIGAVACHGIPVDKRREWKCS